MTVRFFRRKRNTEPPAPKVWVWRCDPLVGGKVIITRFFFKELLDLPDMFGEKALAAISFSEVATEKSELRVYPSYIAVQWNPAPDDDIESVIDRVVAAGIEMLSLRFGWGENLVVEYFDGLDELAALRHRENPGGFRWVLGMG